MDRLFESGLDERGGAGDEREEAVLELLGLLDDYPVEEPEDALVHATVTRVDREEADRQARFHIQNAPRVAPTRVRIPDFFAVAAALLFAVGIGVPLVESMSAAQQRLGSQNRQRAVHAAIAGFAGDSDDRLPFDSELMGPDAAGKLPCGLRGRWSHHLDLLADQERLPSNYLHMGASPTTGQRLVSYRVAIDVPTFTLGRFDGEEPLVADPNPLIEDLRSQVRPCSEGSGADLHEGRGVVVCFFDGTVCFLDSPILDGPDGEGDSLWAHEGYEEGSSDTHHFHPASEEDAVLSH